MPPKTLISIFLILWVILQILFLGISGFYSPVDISQLIGKINLQSREMMLVEITILLFILTFLPGYLIQQISKAPKGWISACILSLTFDLLIGILLSTVGWLKPVILVPLYLTVLILSIYIFIISIKSTFISSPPPIPLLMKRGREGEFFKLEYLFFYILFFIFLIYPRWFWSVIMRGPWPGDPIDRLARAQLLAEGFNLWRDIIPGEMTWYPPLWNILMAIVHHLSGLRLYSVTSGSIFFMGTLVFCLLFAIGRKIFGNWGGVTLCLLSLYCRFMVFSAYQGAATPHGFAYIPLLATIFCLYVVNENRYYYVLAGLSASLALMTYPQTGYISFAYFLLHYLFILPKENQQKLRFDFLTGFILCILIASIYWFPFIWKYGISPPDQSWLRSMYKTAVEIRTFADFEKYILYPYFLDFILVILGFMYLQKWKFGNKFPPTNESSVGEISIPNPTKDVWGQITLFILVLFLGQFALRWHHLITDPLFGFSIQPDRFERFQGLARGLLYTWALFYLYLSLAENVSPVMDSLFGLSRFHVYVPQAIALLIFVLMIFFRPFNEYYSFLKKLTSPETIRYRYESDIPKNLPPYKFLEEDSLLEIVVHPYPHAFEIWLGLWFQEKIPRQSVVLAPIWESWYNVTGLGGRRVFVNMPAYHGPMDTSQPKREQIMKTIYLTRNLEQAEQLIQDNHIDYVCKFGAQFERYYYGAIFNSPNLVPVFGLDTIVTVYQYRPRTQSPSPNLTIFGDSPVRVSPWIQQFERENYFVQFAPYLPFGTEPVNALLHKSENTLLVDSMNFSNSFPIDSLISYVESGNNLILIGNSALGLLQTYGEKAQKLIGVQEIQSISPDQEITRAIYSNRHYLTQDLPTYATALIAPLDQPVYISKNSTGARILGWMAENRKYALLTENKIGKGRVIVWGIDYYQMGELQQVTLLHRLAEYLRSPNQPFVPLSMGVKNIVRPTSQETIRSDKDQYIHIISPDHS